MSKLQLIVVSAHWLMHSFPPSIYPSIYRWVSARKIHVHVTPLPMHWNCVFLTLTHQYCLVLFRTLLHVLCRIVLHGSIWKYPYICNFVWKHFIEIQCRFPIYTFLFFCRFEDDGDYSKYADDNDDDEDASSDEGELYGVYCQSRAIWGGFLYGWVRSEPMREDVTFVM